MSRFQKLRQNGSQASIVRRQRGTVDQSPVRLATGAWVLSIAPAMLPWDATSPSSCCPSVTRQTRLPPSASSTRRNTGQLQHPGIPAVHQVGAVSDGPDCTRGDCGRGQWCALRQFGDQAGQPSRFARWWTFKRTATSRSRTLLAAKNRPSRRPPSSFLEPGLSAARRLSRVARGCPSALRRARPCLRGRGGR